MLYRAARITCPSLSPAANAVNSACSACAVATFPPLASSGSGWGARRSSWPAAGATPEAPVTNQYTEPRP